MIISKFAIMREYLSSNFEVSLLEMVASRINSLDVSIIDLNMTKIKALF